MRWASLLLKIPDNWMTEMLHEHDMSIRVFGCRPYESSGGRGLLRISSRNLDAILESIKSRKEVLRTNLSRISDQAAAGEVVLDRCAACTALKQSECFMVSSRSAPEGRLEWTVAAESSGRVHDLIDLLEKHGCDVHSTDAAAYSGHGITQRQEEILLFAYSSGYFEYPRRIRLKELSMIFDISTSTVCEILRAGQRRVFSEYFTFPHIFGKKSFSDQDNI